MSSEQPLFRLVNGEIQRIPGDKRDPDRLYIMHGSSEGSYVREMTNDEEREHKEWQIQAQAESARMQEEHEKQRIAAEAFRSSLIYETRIIAFIDILGWSDWLSKSEGDSELTKNLGAAINGLRVHVKAAESLHDAPFKWPGDPQVTQFSDSIVLSYLPSDVMTQSRVENQLNFIIFQLLNAGLLVRGAVVIGQVVHRGSIIYGPGLVEAYRLETNKAQYPRIILSPELAEVWVPGVPHFDQQGVFRYMEEPWRRDHDRSYFLKFLEPQFEFYSPENQIYINNMRSWEKILCDNIKNYRDEPKILAKYLWLARYFNSVLTEYPAARIKKIDLNSCL